jgi:hypothetical protein
LIRNHFRIDQPVRHHLWFCGPHSTTHNQITHARKRRRRSRKRRKIGLGLRVYRKR